MEELYITLKCRDCDNTDCSVCPCGTFLTDEDERGCTRKISENDYAKYNHYINEVLPFLHLNTNKESISRICGEILEFLNYIYMQPLGQKIGKSGRALTG